MEGERKASFSRFQRGISEPFQMFQAREEAERTDGTLFISERTDLWMPSAATILLKARSSSRETAFWRSAGPTYTKAGCRALTCMA